MRSVGRRHDPLVVRLVQALVQERMVKASMDPIYAEICEHQEDRKLDPVPSTSEPAEKWVREAWISRSVVDEAVTADFGDEEGHCEDGHDRYALACLPYLERHLILEVLRVLEGFLVEYEHVGESRAGEVDYEAEEPGSQSAYDQSA